MQEYRPNFRKPGASPEAASWYNAAGGRARGRHRTAGSSSKNSPVQAKRELHRTLLLEAAPPGL